MCELNAAKKTGHVCRQQINENKVASSSYSGAPAERSASIYTTQGSDLIWETDLHPRTWMARAKEGERCKRRRRRRRRRRERKERREEGEETMEATAEQRRWEETRRERQDGRATEERGYTGVYPRIHSPIVRLFPSSEWPNRIESNHPAWTMKTNYALLVYVRTYVLG